MASRCGFTPQYEELQALHERFAGQGFLVLGFPANNFLNQEPGTNEEIMELCRTHYGVTFPMFEKISVEGKDQHSLYKFLTSKETNPEYGGEIAWNLDRFLLARDGRIRDRFGARTKPFDSKVVAAIEQVLAQKQRQRRSGARLESSMRPADSVEPPPHLASLGGPAATCPGARGAEKSRGHGPARAATRIQVIRLRVNLVRYSLGS